MKEGGLRAQGTGPQSSRTVRPGAQQRHESQSFLPARPSTVSAFPHDSYSS